jgi:hypothetical protein
MIDKLAAKAEYHRALVRAHHEDRHAPGTQADCRACLPTLRPVQAFTYAEAAYGSYPERARRLRERIQDALGLQADASMTIWASWEGSDWTKVEQWPWALARTVIALAAATETTSEVANILQRHSLVGLVAVYAELAEHEAHEALRQLVDAGLLEGSVVRTATVGDEPGVDEVREARFALEPPRNPDEPPF